jgi:UDP-N-acetylmuramoyl-tripeptide--D-alanyl-D-alanine ligase
MLSVWPWLQLLALAQIYLAWRRSLAYLRYFQQEGYEAIRFLKWANIRSLTDPAFWLSVACAFLCAWRPAVAVAAFLIGAILLGWLQPDPRRSGKIPLRLTWRARRVLTIVIVLATALWMLSAYGYSVHGIQAPLIASSIVFAFFPLVLVLANLVLLPYERHVQRSYEVDAARHLADVRPLIIGITGSYGKSSSKAVLAHILQFHAPTLAASGSINTLMGITRHIREELVTGHRYMVVEMGAFKTGSIRRLCELTPPSAGLITAVGDMHLERFGSHEEIVKAKGELAEALPPGGVLVVNADSPGALKIARASTRCRVLLYGETSGEDLSTRVERFRVSNAGSSVVLRTAAAEDACVTPLGGRPIIRNLAGAFTLATALGVDPAIAVASLRTLKPVANRLEVVDEGGITWIRDAYNSNQLGFRAALEVAAALPACARVLATPGVIELGPQQFDVNRALSREASAVCDHTLVVSDTNREAFVAGHRDAGREPKLVTVETRDEAFGWLKEHVTAGDLVILENDLPDLYEQSAGVFWKERPRRDAQQEQGA